MIPRGERRRNRKAVFAATGGTGFQPVRHKQAGGLLSQCESDFPRIRIKPRSGAGGDDTRHPGRGRLLRLRQDRPAAGGGRLAPDRRHALQRSRLPSAVDGRTCAPGPSPGATARKSSCANASSGARTSSRRPAPSTGRKASRCSTARSICSGARSASSCASCSSSIPRGGRRSSSFRGRAVRMGHEQDERSTLSSP